MSHMPQMHNRRSYPLPTGESAALFCNTKEWVKGFGFTSSDVAPLSPKGERERTELAS
jgi:hypothetical protein